MLTLLAATTAQAKTTYIPTYRNYLHIVADGDTMSISNRLDTLSLADPSGLFELRIDQEDVTKEKVKSIKRAKRAANLMAFSAVMSGLSTTLSSDIGEYLVRSSNTRAASVLADIYADDAKGERTLGVDLYIDNTSGGELMVCDVERGLTWWVLPNRTMYVKLSNPDVSVLRISDVQSRTVRYVMAAAGSRVNKYTISYETDEYWYSPVYHPDKPSVEPNVVYYRRISKRDYRKENISVMDYMEIKPSK